MSDIKQQIEALFEEADSPYQYNGLDGVTRVQDTGGGEGEGEYVCWVWKVTLDNVDHYVMKTGSYYSYEGIEWDDGFDLCEPRQVMVTQYFVI